MMGPRGARVPSVSIPLVCGPDGNLYGVLDDIGRRHDGFIFRVEPEGGELTIVFEFADSPTRSPAGLTLGPDGLLYGSATFYYGATAGDGKNSAGGVASRMPADGCECFQLSR
jgi:hypothetical protein